MRAAKEPNSLTPDFLEFILTDDPMISGYPDFIHGLVTSPAGVKTEEAQTDIPGRATRRRRTPKRSVSWGPNHTQSPPPISLGNGSDIEMENVSNEQVARRASRSSTVEDLYEGQEVDTGKKGIFTVGPVKVRDLTIHRHGASRLMSWHKASFL